MQSKICLVTGATSGIGAITLLELARMGATVIGVGRNKAQASALAQRIRTETSREPDFRIADLSSQSQIRQLARDIQAQYTRLDVLVNNAGTMFFRRRESVDGIEMTFAVNHLAYYMLTNLLLDMLKAAAADSGEARVVNVASNSHLGAQLDLENLQTSRGYQGMRAYGASKLANVLFTYELARRLEGTAITANALHPGFVATGMGKDNGWLVQLFLPLTRLVGISPEEGAQTSLYLATSPEVTGITGKYYYQCRAKRSDPASYDLELARRLWQISAELTGIDELPVRSENADQDSND